MKFDIEGVLILCLFYKKKQKETSEFGEDKSLTVEK